MLFQDLFNLCVNTLNPLQSRFIFVNYNSLHQINFPENLRISNFQSSQYMAGSLVKTDVEYYKITCWFEFDILPGKMKSTVELNSTMDQNRFWNFSDRANVIICWA